LLIAAHNGQEVVSRQLSKLAGETGSSIGKENFRLAEPAGIEQDVPWCWMAGVILLAHAELKLAQWNPGRLSAPAGVNDFAAEWQNATEGHARLWCIRLLHTRGEY
jgi:hypothetical protein